MPWCGFKLSSYPFLNDTLSSSSGLVKLMRRPRAVNLSPRKSHWRPMVAVRLDALGTEVFSCARSCSRVWAELGLAARYARTFWGVSGDIARTMHKDGGR